MSGLPKKWLDQCLLLQHSSREDEAFLAVVVAIPTAWRSSVIRGEACSRLSSIHGYYDQVPQPPLICLVPSLINATLCPRP